MILATFLFSTSAFAALLRNNAPGGCPRVICSSAVDACGNPYGGCYNSCATNFDDAFPPDCSSPVPSSTHTLRVSTTNVLRVAVSVITDPVTVSVSQTATDIPTVVNTPTVTGASSTTANATFPSSTIKPISSCKPRSICADYVNSCHMRYGGCYDANSCDGSIVSFTPPPCPTMTTVIDPAKRYAALATTTAA